MPDRDRRDEKQVETAEERCPKKPANAEPFNSPFFDRIFTTRPGRCGFLTEPYVSI